jgi:UDP-N-acetylmuramyl tripeptide synthase
MRILDSRRLTGPNLLLDGPGAILDVALSGLDPDAAIRAWRAALSPLLEAVGWGNAGIATRAYPGGLLLAFSAPLDALYAATEVNEAAWHAAAETLGGGETPREHPRDPHDLHLGAADGDGDAPVDADATIAGLRAAVERERQPALTALASEASRRGLSLLADDRRVSVGLGSGSRAWPAEETGAVVGHLPWNELHDIPVALVTGTNGKTTIVRLLGAMAKAAGLTAGVASTDRVTVGDDVVAEGDYSGPNGARSVLRDRRVEMAMLEVARGGLLRRGLALPRARAALVTNVANDHLGEFGIFDLPSLADAKMVVARAIGPEGRLVLNADDPLLVERGESQAAPVIWFTLDAASAVVVRHLERGGEACLLDGETLVFARGHERRPIARCAEVPLTFCGTARHNVANVLAAMGVALALGIPEESVRRGLLGFESNPAHNPGRANVWDLAGVTVIVDFAHNPHGLVALVEMARAMPARRRAIVVGQAGDRDDESIREFARAAAALGPDRVFIKEMEHYLRGREPGVVPAMIERELLRMGTRAEALVCCESEMAAVRAALLWATEGDLLLMTTHEVRDEVIALVEGLAGAGWKPGSSLIDATTAPKDAT